MITWIETNIVQIALVIGVIILITVGRGPLLPRVKQSKFLRWLAFAVTAACGLILGYALYGVMGWLTGLRGTAAGALASIGAIVAVNAGWWAIRMLVTMCRDLADGVPDEEARTAALWIPTMAPAGLSAAWDVATNPQGISTTITSIIIGVCTVVWCVKISRDALKGSKGKLFWKIFASVTCLLGGLVLIPIVAFVDAQAAKNIHGPWLNGARIVLFILSLALLVASLVDWFEKTPDRRGPDEHVRRFALIGVPLMVLFGAMGWSTVSGAALSGSEILLGGAL